MDEIQATAGSIVAPGLGWIAHQEPSLGRTNKRWLSEVMTGWNQSKHTDQISETKESSCTIIDTGGNVSIVISQ